MVRVVWASSALAVSIACAVQEQGAPVGTGRALESGGMDGAGGAGGEGSDDGTTTGVGGTSASTTTTDSGMGGSATSAVASSSGGTGGTAGTGGSATGGTTGGTGGAGCEDGDCCPDDPDKTDPGACGCGVPDDDADADTVADCDDACPDDPDKADAGSCGCGLAEGPGCDGLIEALVHRYSFDGSNSEATDSAGSADGTILNTTLSGAGFLDLAGTTSDEYVDLPNGIVSSLSDATFEAWVTWTGGSAWQRVFDFGSNQGGEDAQGTGETYLFLTPRHSNSSGVLRVAFSTDGNANETQINAAAALALDRETHLAVVVDAGNQIVLYIDGALEASVSFSGQLSDIIDVNNWLGRSQFPDPDFQGSLNEFRIYDATLSAAEVAKSFEAGPDPAFLDP